MFRRAQANTSYEKIDPRTFRVLLLRATGQYTMATKHSIHPSLEAVGPCLYLVTDSTPAILRNRDLVSVVSDALKGGVTMVQYRDKTSETIDLIKMGRRLH